MTEQQHQDSNLKLLSDITTYSKYAKFLPDVNRRETWEEICWRNAEMHIKKYPQLKEEIKKVYQEFVIPKKVLASMRSFQFAGRPIELSNNRIFNCLARETKFVTSGGVRSFEDFNDGDELTVLTHLGNWKRAKVRNYGKQKLQKLTFVRGKSNDQIVWATKNHRWILRDLSEVTELRIGDLLHSAPNIFNEFDFDSAEVFEKLYWCYGYVFGDGTLIKNKHGEYKHSMVRLCDHDRQFASRFEEVGFTTSQPLSCKGDFMAYTGTYLKEPPNPNIDPPNLIRAFVRGYLDADGGKAPQTPHNKFRNIQATGQKYIDFIRSCFPIAGVFISSEQDLTHQVTNFGPRQDTTIRFIISTNLSESAKNLVFTTKNIDLSSEREEDVWCLEVEDDHSFILDFGLATGNCSYIGVNHYKVFPEIMFLLLGGSGVGYSVQKHDIEQLPVIQKPTKSRRYLIGDSIEGWADAIKVLIKGYLCHGTKPRFDFSDIRKKGTALKTSGGKAPGPQPLKDCIYNLEKILESKDNGEKLKPIEVHDMICHIADAVLAGGIRRAALICLFDLDDEEMIACKSGNWWELNPQRGRANNSAVLVRSEMTEEKFFDLWRKMRASGSGEPGIFFTNSRFVGMNPCSEISLKDTGGLCNLTEINLSDITDQNDFNNRSRAASFLGTLQASYTDFHYLRDCWKKTAEDEALLGVGGTGIASQAYLKCNLEEAAKVVKEENERVAKLIGINSAARLTCVKPAGCLEISTMISTSYGDMSLEKIFALHGFNLSKLQDKENFWIDVPKFDFLEELKVKDIKNEWKKVTKFYIKGKSKGYKLSFHPNKDHQIIPGVMEFISNTYEVTCTPEHKFQYAKLEDIGYVVDWKAAKDLEIGDEIRGYETDSDFLHMKKKLYLIAKEEISKSILFVDLEVEDTHSYQLANGIVTHNTTSCVLGTSSGIHAWFDKFYIRRLEFNKIEPIYHFLMARIPELMEDHLFRPHQSAFLKIPIKAPEGAITAPEETALQLLERIKYFSQHWIKPGHVKGENTHNVSATVYIKENEWDDVGNWMWNNREHYNGLAVLPFDGGTYTQTPFESITEEEYNQLSKFLDGRDLDFREIYEDTDETNLTGEIACAGGACEIGSKGSNTTQN